jgi:hypothetical protein
MQLTRRVPAAGFRVWGLDADCSYETYSLTFDACSSFCVCSSLFLWYPWIHPNKASAFSSFVIRSVLFALVPVDATSKADAYCSRLLWEHT